MENKVEIWKDIPDYEGMYQVSNLGRVKSLKRLDSIGRKLNEKILKGCVSNEYIMVGLWKKGSRYVCYIHILAAIAFLNHIPCGHLMEVDHIDNDKLNNQLSNLQIVTHRENTTKDRKPNKLNEIGISKLNHGYFVSVGFEKKTYCLGTHKTLEEAKKIRDEAYLKIKNNECFFHLVKKRKENENPGIYKLKNNNNENNYYFRVLINGVDRCFSGFKTIEQALIRKKTVIEERNNMFLKNK